MFLTDVKILLQMEIGNCEHDELLAFLLRQVKRKILNYCNIDEIPLSHEYIVAEMVAAYYNLMYKAYEEEKQSNVETCNRNSNSRKVVKESVGDYSVEYETGESFSRTIPTPDTSKLEAVLLDYKSELNQIRKLRL